LFDDDLANTKMSTRQSDTPDSSNPYSYSKMQLKRYCKAAFKITTFKSFAAATVLVICVFLQDLLVCVTLVRVSAKV